jgi:hypothetical protein
MAVTDYTDESFSEITGIEKNNFSFLRLFNILQDNDRETLFLNIFRSYLINNDVLTNVTFFDTYEVAAGENWDNVSYNLYGTPYLWWIVALLNQENTTIASNSTGINENNGIGIINPFEDLNEGDILTVLKDDYVYQIIADLERISEE